MRFYLRILFTLFLILTFDNAFGQLWFEKEKVIGKVETITENSYQIKGNDTIPYYCNMSLHFNKKGKVDAVLSCNDRDSVIYDEITDKLLQCLSYKDNKLSHITNMRHKGNVSERYMTEDGKERLQFTFLYNEKGSLIKSILHTRITSYKPTIRIFEYDNQNRLIKEILYREGHETTPIKIINYIYDKKNNYISTSKTFEKGVEVTTKGRFEFDNII